MNLLEIINKETIVSAFNVKDILDVEKDVGVFVVRDEVLVQLLQTELNTKGIVTSSYAVVVVFGSGTEEEDTKYILVRSSVAESLDLLKIVLAHEYQHIMGIESEELADYKALELLDDEAKGILVSQWKFRHGRSFDQFVKLSGE